MLKNKIATLFAAIFSFVNYVPVDDVDVVVEATGHPGHGISHARKCFQYGKHVIMVNVEADVLAGAYLSKEAKSANVVYSMAYGDQPALTIEIIEWARASGFNVTAAGKGTKYLPEFHASTPDTVWNYYGLNKEEAEIAGMNPKMFNSFLDGTKSSLEMAAIANASEMCVPDDGLLFTPCGMDDLAKSLKPRDKNGVLKYDGQVEVVSSVHRDGKPVYRDLRWGVYVVIEAPNNYTTSCFQQYGLTTDTSGKYTAMYRPFHLIGLELNISIFAAFILNKATGSPISFSSDVVAVAKRNLKAGQFLDGEGGYTVWGKLFPAAKSVRKKGLPIGLANHIKLKNDIIAGNIVKWQDVEIDETSPIVLLRRKMEQRLKVRREPKGF